ncbi:hypothetical protein DK867_14170 [Ochrobactrum sp. POC9]|uniref:hypothetical protein n=1 Tax=Ochrobactrum sp. POC9 TaxID=2203419 RepID=UPI000D705F60|nr:hypothetical protein [Ochrobactrum sp. POC9]PWU72368.1 hypothetical protein DK867_14170 [Ochrobactrum sp. POC9]
MSKEHEKQTITELAVKLASIGPVQGYQTRTVYKDGKLTFTAEPEADDGADANLKPFKVDEDGVVYMDNAKVDYEALNKDVGELMQFLDSRIGTLRQEILRMSAKTGGEHASHISMNFYVGEPRLTVEPTDGSPSDPRKHVGETFAEACKSWTESIAEATGPRSDLAKTIEHLTVCLDPEELYDDLVKSPEFKSVIVDALHRSARTVHIKL